MATWFEDEVWEGGLHVSRERKENGMTLIVYTQSKRKVLALFWLEGLGLIAGCGTDKTITVIQSRYIFAYRFTDTCVHVATCFIPSFCMINWKCTDNYMLYVLSLFFSISISILF